MAAVVTSRSGVEYEVEAALAAALPDVDLRDVQIVGIGADAMLRIVIDHPAGVDHDLCVATTRVLDAAGLRERYGIEVSSPGPEPPLRTHGHYRAAVGDRVRLRVSGGPDARTRSVTGVLDAVEDDRVKIATPDGERWVAFAEITRGRVVERSVR